MVSTGCGLVMLLQLIVVAFQRGYGFESENPRLRSIMARRCIFERRRFACDSLTPRPEDCPLGSAVRGGCFPQPRGAKPVVVIYPSSIYSRIAFEQA